MILSEESRRMQDMMKMYGMDAAMYGGEELSYAEVGTASNTCRTF